MNYEKPIVNNLLGMSEVTEQPPDREQSIASPLHSKSVMLEGGADSDFSESEEFDSDIENDQFQKKVFFSQQAKIFQFRSGL